MSLTLDDLKTLRKPFPKDRLGIKIQSLSRQKDKAMLVAYLQHTDVQDRIEEVDPTWTCEVLHEERTGDTVYVRMSMTLKGVTRVNVGEGGDPKGAYSDAIKRCAMLFGVGRYLYDSETVWVTYDETRDRYRSWSYDDYDRALKAHQASIPLGEDVPPPKTLHDLEQTPDMRRKTPLAVPRANGNGVKKSERSEPSEDEKARKSAQTKLFAAYRTYSSKIPDVQMSDLLKRRYGKERSEQLTLAELIDLTQFMEAEAEAVF